MPKVSIILTSYNRPRLIGSVIQSVIDQTYEEWELWIMDDHSQEETVQAIAPFISDPRVHFYNSKIEDKDRYKTTRYATLINEAIRLSEGDYICYLTDDTFYYPDKLSKMVTFLQDHPQVDVVYSSQCVKHTDPAYHVFYESEIKAETILEKAAFKVDHCSVMHTRTLAQKVRQKYGEYWDDDPKYWHCADAVFWSRLNDFACFYPLPEPLEYTLKATNCFQYLYANLPEDIPDGTLVKGLKDELFLIENQKRRPISEQMFRALQYESSKIVMIPDPFLFRYSEGIKIAEDSPLPNKRLVTADNIHYYYLQQGCKCLIENEAAFSRYHFQDMPAIQLSEKQVIDLPDGSMIRACIKTIEDAPELLYVYDDRYFLYHDHLLHEMQIEVVLKLKLSLAQAVSLTDREFHLFKQGKGYEWKLPVSQLM
ncbi:protein CgeD [Pullulanibacillus camelliae]|uniref:Protein CgeD n=1 Tax=Pullulanibacillus camelliae TaxID=1707096 RepID=A0A8J2VRD2_9BACL|nr:glycosyltransferase family A protein [Pullulanibacillus camelliae]GGE39316.1 protein CgeD [Pullulanibacillus camelliae]